MNSEPTTRETGQRSLLANRILPYLLAIWCCLSILQGSPENIPSPLVLIKTLAIVLAGVGVAHLCFYLLIRKSPARELILFVLVSFLGLYGFFANLLSGTLGQTGFFVTWSLLHLVVAIAVYRYSKKSFVQIATPIALFGIVITVLFQLAGIAIPTFNDYRHVAKVEHDLNVDNPLASVKSVGLEKRKPDIYYIVVDAYAREDVLNEVYGFDNQPFIDDLQQRGFYIGDASRSNYHLTELSVASSLNMTHLPDLGLRRFKTRLPIRKMIKKNRVVTFLKRMGYTTVGLESGKSDTECKNFDHYVRFGKGLNDYQDVLYHASALPVLFSFAGNAIRSAARRHGDRVVFALDEIPTLVKADSKPTFVFSHLLAPHPPYVFDAEGNEVDFHGYYLLADGTSFTACYDYDLDLYRETYCNQLAFINQKLLSMVDEIKSNGRESIIVIQADHGPRLGFGVKPYIKGDTESMAAITDPNMRYREGFSILNAIHMPEGTNPAFYSDMTPVNSFRLIFNATFGTKLRKEPDDSYFEEGYEFRDSTVEAMPLNETNATETAVTQSN